MENNTQTQGRVVKSQDAVESKISASYQLDVGCSMLDVGCFPTGSDISSCSAPFDDLRATQARAALIQFTKTFFGLDSNAT